MHLDCCFLFEANGEDALRIKEDGNSGVKWIDINEAIAAEYKRLESLAKAEENDPVLVEGETPAGYYCQMMVNPKDVACILLDYNYPVWRVLEEGAPDGM